MKKVFSIVLMALFVIGAFTACHNETLEMNTGEVAYGELDLTSLGVNLDVYVDTIYQQSRANVSVSDFVITVFNAEKEQVEKWTYNKMPELVSLPVGSYTITASSPDGPQTGFDVPYYEGEVSCTITENQITTVEPIVCRLATSMFTIQFSDDLLPLLGNDVQVIISVGDNELVFTKSETRKGYIVVPNEETAFNVELKGTVDGEWIDINKRSEVAVAPCQNNIIRFELDSVHEDSSVTGSRVDFDIELSINSEWIISKDEIDVKPGNEPTIDDFPSEGTEGGNQGGSQGEGDEGTSDANQPQIIGSNFNGSPFDISNDELIVPTSISMDNPMTLQVMLKASQGIAHVYVTIDSETLTDDLLSGVGLSSNFDLANPGSLSSGLSGLGFPVGNEVIGKTQIVFDITQFTPLLGIYGAANHNFIIRLVDQNGLEVTKTLKIKSAE